MRTGKVIIIDYKEHIREMLCRFLPKMGFSCVSSSNSIHATQLASTFKPDIAIVDIDLPEMDGFEVVKSLRKNLPELKTIFMYDRADFNSTMSALNLRVNSFFQRPLDLDKLLLTLTKMDHQISEKKREEIKKNQIAAEYSRLRIMYSICLHLYLQKAG